MWDFTFNSKRAEVEYVHVRDFDNELTYSGWVEVFSETGGTRELVLRDVEIRAIDGTDAYTMPRVYLARPVDKITIEFPYYPNDRRLNVSGNPPGKRPTQMTHDGFNKASRPLTEGYSVKGGQNLPTSQVSKRPPAPPPIPRPTAKK